MKRLVLILAAALCPLWSAAQIPPPSYLSLAGSPKDFELFANGGWDGNWYVGYNSTWIVELPPVPGETSWARAFIGAKLGRMKSNPVAGQPPWTREPIPCDIFMGIASAPAWRASEGFHLVSCEDIPLEGSPEDALQGVGGAVWFWTEVPVRALNTAGKNYLAVWSPTPDLTSAALSPIIAASGAKGAVNAWLNRATLGSPPSKPEEALETRLHAFAPSLALKLVPENSTSSVRVELVSFSDNGGTYRWEVLVEAKNFTRLRPQISLNGTAWISFGRPLNTPPFILSLPIERIQKETAKLTPSRKKTTQVYLRLTAWDEWENQGSTPIFTIPLP